MFGCLEYVYTFKEEKKTMDNKTRKYQFVGYNTKNKAYMIYGIEKRRIEILKDIIFNKEK